MYLSYFRNILVSIVLISFILVPKSSQASSTLLIIRSGMGRFSNIIEGSTGSLTSYGSPEVLLSHCFNQHLCLGGVYGIFPMTSAQNTDFTKWGVFLRYYWGTGFLTTGSDQPLFEYKHQRRWNWFLLAEMNMFEYSFPIDPNALSLDFRTGTFNTFSTGIGLTYKYNKHIYIDSETNVTVSSLSKSDIRVKPLVYFYYFGLAFPF